MSEKVLVKVSDLPKIAQAQSSGLEVRPEGANEVSKDIANAERRRDLENEQEAISKEIASEADSSSFILGTPDGQDDSSWRRFLPPDMHSQAAKLLELSRSSPWVKIENGHVYINGQYVAPLSVVLFSLYGNFEEHARHLRDFKMLLNPFQTEIEGVFPNSPQKKVQKRKRNMPKGTPKAKTRLELEFSKPHHEEILQQSQKEDQSSLQEAAPSTSGHVKINFGHARMPNKEDEWNHLDQHLSKMSSAF